MYVVQIVIGCTTYSSKMIEIKDIA
jgi:hypothetical protein